MLSVQGVSKSYSRGRWGRRERICVLDGVTLDVEPGSVVGLVGANGAGKTTLLHAIARLVNVDAGSILLNGSEISAARARRDVALCSSADRSFYFRLTLRDNLRFFGRLGGLHGRDLEQRIGDALAQTRLEPFADRRYSACSTGTRQRLTFARALLSDAPVFLLDEPTRAVDALHAAMMRQFVRETLRTRMRKCVILATNILEEAWSVCDRVVLLSHGKAAAADTPAALAELLTSRVRYRIEFEQPYPGLLDRLREFGNVDCADGCSVDLTLPAGSEPLGRLLHEIVRGGFAVKAISSHVPAPDDLFGAATS